MNISPAPLMLQAGRLKIQTHTLSVSSLGFDHIYWWERWGTAGEVLKVKDLFILQPPLGSPWTPHTPTGNLVTNQPEDTPTQKGVRAEWNPGSLWGDALF